MEREAKFIYKFLQMDSGEIEHLVYIKRSESCIIFKLFMNTFIQVKSNVWNIGGETNNLGSKASTTGCTKAKTNKCIKSNIIINNLSNPSI